MIRKKKKKKESDTLKWMREVREAEYEMLLKKGKGRQVGSRKLEKK